jgi:predicted DNA-binding transcriptional regulator AlpA
METQMNENSMELNDGERLLESRQVMFLLSCSKTYLDKLVKRGILKPILHGNRYKFFYRDVYAYIERLKSNRDRDCGSSGVSFLNLQIN